MHVTLDITDELVVRFLKLGYIGIEHWVRDVRSYDGAIPEELKHVPPTERRFYIHQTCGKWIVQDKHDMKRHALTPTALELGMKLLAERYPRSFSVLLGNDREPTIEDGDTLIQLALFGDWRYRVAPDARITANDVHQAPTIRLTPRKHA